MFEEIPKEERSGAIWLTILIFAAALYLTWYIQRDNTPKSPKIIVDIGDVEYITVLKDTSAAKHDTIIYDARVEIKYCY